MLQKEQSNHQISYLYLVSDSIIQQSIKGKAYLHQDCSQLHPNCGGLNGSGSRRLIYVTAWSLVDGGRVGRYGLVDSVRGINKLYKSCQFEITKITESRSLYICQSIQRFLNTKYQLLSSSQYVSLRTIMNVSISSELPKAPYFSVDFSYKHAYNQ